MINNSKTQDPVCYTVIYVFTRYSHTPLLTTSYFSFEVFEVLLMKMITNYAIYYKSVIKYVCSFEWCSNTCHLKIIYKKLFLYEMLHFKLILCIIKGQLLS